MTGATVHDLFLSGGRLGMTDWCGPAGHQRVSGPVQIALFGGRVCPTPPGDGAVLILPADEAAERPRRFESLWMKIVCCAAAERELVPASLRRFSVRTGIPVFASRYGAFLLQSRIIGILREKGDRRLTVHGVLVALDRRGVLMTGESGSGKTVSGLALAAAGARWVADDAVALERRGDAVYGRGHERTRHLIALREQGIVRVDRWLGEGVLIPEARVDLIMELDRGPLREEFRRQSREILGIQIPCLYLKDDSGPSGIVERITAFFDGNPSVAATNG